ncbi:ChbG/HpnK family deacetylase [Ramlibacter sp. MMS24-I3-19]|uniref:ChbG/HpnK family deacetylase n=1 Tax=Ramlibacter sp. MMS24-I3-19 TaxID=3416606 RepID=UPI003CFFEC54
MKAPVRRLVVCIDDFGWRPGVDQAVLELAQLGAVSATSCMVGSPRWTSSATGLRALPPGTLDIGLHVDFTLSPLDKSLRCELGAFIARAYLGRLSPVRIAMEVRAQFDAFEQVMGRVPDHVDGHHHVHQLPVVQDAILEEFARRGLRRTWLRGTQAPRGEHGLKPRLIAALGGKRLRARAAKLGIPVSGHLLGAYGFDSDPQAYERLLADWLQRAMDGDVLMCHPAYQGPDAVGDVFAPARANEVRVLASDAWPRLLAQAGVTVSRFAPPA